MSEDRCICCGEIVPEGRMVCPYCENHIMTDREAIAILKNIYLSGGRCNGKTRLTMAISKAVKALEKQINENDDNL